MRFIFSVMAILLSLDSLALSFEGNVSRAKAQLKFNDPIQRKTYALNASTALISTYINKLSDGDFISLEGYRDEKHTVLTVSSVNYIGLNMLLGTWVGDDLYCYTFVSYTEFTISYRGIAKKCPAATAPIYTYFVNPSTTTWVMLLAGDRGSYVGDLIIHNPKDIEIQLYDSETGDILRKIHLRK